MINIKSARDLGPQFVKNEHRMVGQDGAFSIPLNGETLWFFGDTLIGSRKPGESLWYYFGEPVGPKDMSGMGTIEKMINNTGLLLNESTGSNGLNNFSYILNEEGKLKQLIPLLEDEHPDEIRIWCLHGIKLKEKLYLFFIKVRMIEGAVLPVNFEVLGSGLAVGSDKDWEFKRIEFKGSHLLWKKNDPKFASAVLHVEEENMLYLYGVVNENNIQNCYLARVHPEEIENLEKYEYLATTGPEWSFKLKNAITIFSNMPNEMSVSFNKYLGCYLAVHSFNTTGKIVGRTAPNPWGPWSEPTLLWEVKVNREKELPYPILIYAGKEHPSLSQKDGKVIYITYIEFEEYFPHLVEITFE